MKPACRVALVSLVTAMFLVPAGRVRGADPVELPDGVEAIRAPVERDVAPQLGAAQREQFALDNQRFAFALYAALAKGEGGNLFFSPYTISSALALAHAGAEAQTEREIALALHFGLPEPALHAAFNATDRALAGRAKEVAQADAAVRLALTSAAFVQKGMPLSSAYLDTLARSYGSGLYAVDFAHQAERARVGINSWIAQKTERRIESLLPQGSVGGDVRLLLASAVYFKGAWQEPFDPVNTTDAPFHASSGDVSVPMMHARSQVSYAAGDGWAALELPYASPSVRMLLVLPDAGRFTEIEARLAAEFLKTVRDALRLHRVEIALPRFSYRAAAELGQALGSLGMKSAFDPATADFSGMNGKKRDLYLHSVLHQAFVAVDEQGTTASAATAVLLSPASLPRPASIAFDRPFLYLIYDEPTGQILFLGRLLEPEQLARRAS